MKSSSLTRCGLSAALVAGGLFGLAPAASAIPVATCDSQPDQPFLTVVEGLAQNLVDEGRPLDNDGFNCVDRPDQSDQAGEDGANVRRAPDPVPDEADVDEDSDDPLVDEADPEEDAEPESEEADEAEGDEVQPESDSARRQALADAVADAVLETLEEEDPSIFEPAAGPVPAAEGENFLRMLETQVVELLKMF